MSIEFGHNAPWLDNWPVYRQLWQFAGSREPGEELDLSNVTDRALTAQWRDSAGDIAFASSESGSEPLIKISNAARGIVSITPGGALWDSLTDGQTYDLEIIAYGVLYSSEEYRVLPPSPGSECLNGITVYGAPRQILELLGTIPGASTQVSLELVGAWVLNAQGYWTTTVASNLSLFGFWIDDHYAPQVDYADLGLGSSRAIARVGDTLYYKGPENPNTQFTETAFSRYVLRCLQEASAEVERRTGRKFGLWRYYRETYRGLRRQRQINVRQFPFHLDDHFRLDALSYSRTLFRRYTEKDFDFRLEFSNSQLLHVDSPTGVITINQAAWDFWDWGYAISGDVGLANFATLPPGENNIEITYTAGYDKLPSDLDEACVNLATVRQAIFWQQSITQGMQGLSIGCVNLNFGQLFSQYSPGWQSSAYQILEGYTRLEIEAF